MEFHRETEGKTFFIAARDLTEFAPDTFEVDRLDPHRPDLLQVGGIAAEGRYRMVMGLEDARSLAAALLKVSEDG